MTKVELATAFAIEMGIDLREARSIVDTILDTMTEALSRGEGIELRGFCSFTVKHYRSFKGRNPKTGQPVTYFKASKELAEEVNRNR